MKCPNCYFENTRNKNVCENCGSDLHPPDAASKSSSDPSIMPGTGKTRRRPQGNLLKGLWRFIMGIINFFLYIFVIILCAAAILGVLFWQCRVNVPNAPGWKFMPKIVTNYWEWLDDWQMERCPKLTPDNYFFGEEPIPAFDEDGELIIESECTFGTLTFSPASAPAGASFDISLDGFAPEETVKACWYFPSSKLENCLDIDVDPDGHAETAYFSETSYPKGTYTMEAESGCGKVVQEFILE